MHGNEATLLERMGSERGVTRLAISMLEQSCRDVRLAHLYHGYSHKELIAGQRLFLLRLLSDEPHRDVDLSRGLAPMKARGLDRSQIKVLADVLIDCMVSEGVCVELILTVLDRIDTLMRKELGTDPHTPSGWTWVVSRESTRQHLDECSDEGADEHSERQSDESTCMDSEGWRIVPEAACSV